MDLIDDVFTDTVSFSSPLERNVERISTFKHELAFDTFNEIGVIDFLKESNLDEERKKFQQCLNILDFPETTISDILYLFESSPASYFHNKISELCQSYKLCKTASEKSRIKLQVKRILINRIRVKYFGIVTGFGSSAHQTETTPEHLHEQNLTAAQRMMDLISQQINTAMKKGDLSTLWHILNRRNTDRKILTEFLHEVKNMESGIKEQRAIAQKYGEMLLPFYCKSKSSNLENFNPGDSIYFDDLNQFAEYIKLMQQTGIKSYRLSTRWSRIMDHNNEEIPGGIDLYINQIRMLKEAGIEPLVVLNHFELRPGDHWMKPDFLKNFENYSKIVLEKLIPEGVTKWIPINEPAVDAASGFIDGHWFPFEKGRLDEFLRTLRKMGVATQKFYKLAHKIAEENESRVEVILSSNLAKFKAPEVLQTLAETFDRLYITFTQGHYDSLGIQFYWAVQLQNITAARGVDFTKISVQENKFVELDLNGKRINRSSHGNEAEPHYIYDVILRLWEKYQTPIYITEFGVNLSKLQPEDKLWYFEESVKGILKAIHEGIPIKGFWAWTLIKNFEILGVFGGGYESNFGFAAELNLERQLELYKTSDGVYIVDLIREILCNIPNEFPNLKN